MLHASNKSVTPVVVAHVDVATVVVSMPLNEWMKASTHRRLNFHEMWIASNRISKFFRPGKVSANIYPSRYTYPEGDVCGYKNTVICSIGAFINICLPQFSICTCTLNQRSQTKAKRAEASLQQDLRLPSAWVIELGFSRERVADLLAPYPIQSHRIPIRAIPLTPGMCCWHPKETGQKLLATFPTALLFDYGLYLNCLGISMSNFKPFTGSGQCIKAAQKLQKVLGAGGFKASLGVSLGQGQGLRARRLRNLKNIIFMNRLCCRVRYCNKMGVF